MSISINGTSLTGTNLHGTLDATPWDYARVVQPFFGVTGEYHLTGGLRGRQLSAWLLLHGFNSHDAIHTQIEIINVEINTSGSVVWVVGTDTRTFTNCIFDGYTLDEEPWLDGSGVNGWQVRGRLNFRQVKS